MKNLFTLFLFIYIIPDVFSQNEKTLLGIVVNDSIEVQGITITNKQLKKSTITNRLGIFELPIHLGDSIIVSAIHIKRTSLFIDQNILEKGELEIYVLSNITKLKEIALNNILSPSALDFSAAFKQPKKPDPESMRRIEIARMANTDPTKIFGAGGGGGGTGAFNILKPVYMLTTLLAEKIKGKSLSKREKKERKKRFTDDFINEYGMSFFTNELKISELQIDEFISYCDKKESLYKMYSKDQKLDLIDFFVKQSKIFKKK